MTRVLVLHGYSAHNAGDGLLVDLTLDLVREALGNDADITLIASDPESFHERRVDRLLCSQPTRRGWDPDYRRALRRVRDYDLVVAVGGGYLRAGHPVETAKMALVHGPQLLAAIRRGAGTVYLPQSIGPLRWVPTRLTGRLMSRLDAVLLRDPRSIAELGDRPVVHRVPDLAISAGSYARRDPGRIDPMPILSVRAVRGEIPGPMHRLADALGEFDGYVQSAVRGNDDTVPMDSLGPRRVVGRAELVNPAGSAPRRVVVAMRLHGALMALEAGHYVIHAAYERKGFGAFEDLGLPEYVHNSRSLDPELVAEQARALLTDQQVREDYDARLMASLERMPWVRVELVERLRAAAGRRQRS